MLLPDAENQLQSHLVSKFGFALEGPALKVIMDAEGDTVMAIDTVNALASAASSRTGFVIQIPTRPKPPTQLV
ncbi:hypothetical protein BS17DRAFT_683574, partial [Gyrodon lividus]